MLYRWLLFEGEKLSRKYADDWLCRPSVLNLIFQPPMIVALNRPHQMMGEFGLPVSSWLKRRAYRNSVKPY